jgi:hypothetical protein
VSGLAWHCIGLFYSAYVERSSAGLIILSIIIMATGEAFLGAADVNIIITPYNAFSYLTRGVMIIQEKHESFFFGQSVNPFVLSLVFLVFVSGWCIIGAIRKIRSDMQMKITSSMPAVFLLTLEIFFFGLIWVRGSKPADTALAYIIFNVSMLMLYILAGARGKDDIMLWRRNPGHMPLFRHLLENRAPVLFRIIAAFIIQLAVILAALVWVSITSGGNKEAMAFSRTVWSGELGMLSFLFAVSAFSLFCGTVFVKRFREAFFGYLAAYSFLWTLALSIAFGVDGLWLLPFPFVVDPDKAYIATGLVSVLYHAVAGSGFLLLAYVRMRNFSKAGQINTSNNAG